MLLADDNSTQWCGLNVGLLPSTKNEAKEKGIRFFYNGTECAKGHRSPRYAVAGNCVDCTNERVSRKRGAQYTAEGSRAKANIARAIGLLSESKTYVPPRPCKHGHSLRYTGTNNCVQCDADTRERHKAAIKNRRFLKEYGISVVQRDEMIAGQNGLCAICEQELTPTFTHVDHCHLTGKVRGILCSKCNQALGLFGESVEIMRAAIAYIISHQTLRAA